MRGNTVGPQNAPTTPRHRWFQFSLRGLLIAMAVLAVVMAWFGYYAKWNCDRIAKMNYFHPTAHFGCPPVTASSFRPSDNQQT